MMQVGGMAAKFTKAQVKSKDKSTRSLMLVLAPTLSQQEPVKLVTKLKTLK